MAQCSAHSRVGMTQYTTTEREKARVIQKTLTTSYFWSLKFDVSTTGAVSTIGAITLYT